MTYTNSNEEKAPLIVSSSSAIREDRIWKAGAELPLQTGLA